MGLYIVGFVSYGATLVFYAAAFPRLARNTPHSRSLREQHENSYISVEEYEREESLEKNRISNISTVCPGTSSTCDSMLIPVHQVHSNVGYVVTYLLNLALLLSPATANDPKVDNYTLALCVLSSLSNGFIAEYVIGTTRIGFCSEFGGVCVHHRHPQVTDRGLVIYQSPRPGPPLPKGESYLTIGWKQVINRFHDPNRGMLTSRSDLGSSQDL